MQKTGIITTLVLVLILAAGGLIFKQQSYKICYQCGADDYFSRGAEYSCSEKKSYRQTGLEFITNAASGGHFQAELMLAELYSDDLPEEYLVSDSAALACLAQEVTPNQQIGLLYFQAVTDAVGNGQQVDSATLLNLGLLYHKGVLAADDQVAKAMWLYEKAAAAGSVTAMLTLGQQARTAEDYSTALHWLSKAAEGDPADFESPLVVADYYLYGRGTAVDLLQAQKWYKMALSRTEKVNREKRVAQRLTKKVARVRLDIVNRKLEESGGARQQVAVKYSLLGGVKYFVVFVEDYSREHIGVVFNEGGIIHAAINEEADFAALLPDLLQDKNFSSMTDGVHWLLTVFARTTYENSDDMIFDFVLTDS